MGDDDDDERVDDAASCEEVEPYSLLGAVSPGEEEVVLGEP